jgi:hypothetical protein
MKESQIDQMDAKSLKKKLKKMEAHKFENINLRSYNMVL